MMKALTLHQPWASLVAVGVKRILTRSWPAPPSLIGQRFAIHAAARRMDDEQPMTFGPAIYAFPWNRDGATGGDGYLRVGMHKPPIVYGAVVASCVVTDCVPLGWGAIASRPAFLTSHGERVDITDQLPFCDFTLDQWAWLLDDITPLQEPVPCRGHPRVWEWTP